MKIVKKTSNVLDLEISEFPHLIRFFLALMIGGFMVMIGVVPILRKESVILECEYLESNYVDCNIIRISLLGKKAVNFPQLKKAEIETIDLEDTTAYKINLTGSMGKVSLNNNYIYIESESKRILNEINNFIKNNTSDKPNFKLEYHEPIYSYMGMLMIIILGLGMSLLIMTVFEDTNYIFDKDTNTLWRIKKNVFNTKKIFASNLSDITEAIVIEEQKVDDNGQSSTVYQLVFKKSSSAIVLKSEEIDNKKYTEIKDNINHFLRLK